MIKGPLAVLATCIVAIVALAIWMYSLTKSAAAFWVLLVAVPFVLFAIGMSRAMRRPAPRHTQARFAQSAPDDWDEPRTLPVPAALSTLPKVRPTQDVLPKPGVVAE